METVRSPRQLPDDPVVITFVSAFHAAQLRTQLVEEHVRSKTPDQLLAIQPPFTLTTGTSAPEHIPLRIGVERRIKIATHRPFVDHPKGVRNKIYAATVFHVLILFTFNVTVKRCLKCPHRNNSGSPSVVAGRRSRYRLRAHMRPKAPCRSSLRIRKMVWAGIPSSKGCQLALSRSRGRSVRTSRISLFMRNSIDAS